MLCFVNSKMLSTHPIARRYCARMNVKDTRHQNLLLLERRHGRLVDIAKVTEGQISANYLSQLKNRSRDIGDRTARKIERLLGLSDGWMDTIHDSYAQPDDATNALRVADNAAAAYMVSRVPLVSWVQAGTWSTIEDPYPRGAAEEWIPVYERIGRTAFALRVEGDSMTNPAGFPSFPPGTIIIVDPEVEARSGHFVIARLDDEDAATFKQLMIEGAHTYLMPLNPRFPRIDVDRPMTICGVVVDARMRLI